MIVWIFEIDRRFQEEMKGSDCVKMLEGCGFCERESGWRGNWLEGRTNGEIM